MSTSYQPVQDAVCVGAQLRTLQLQEATEVRQQARTVRHTAGSALRPEREVHEEGQDVVQGVLGERLAGLEEAGQPRDHAQADHDALWSSAQTQFLHNSCQVLSRGRILPLQLHCLEDRSQEVPVHGQVGATRRQTA